MRHLDVVICTHNRAAQLDRVLKRLAEQLPPAGMSWSVLVVENACTDETACIVASHQSQLKLAIVQEPQLGLSHARRRGLIGTSGEWVAFVDDDNLLERGWVAAMAQAIHCRPGAGAFGGRVLLHWEVEPRPTAREFGFCFAEQDYGGEPREVECLVGAGLVLNRAALAACGWLTGPMLDDRTGRTLTSGGDVEISVRLRGAGYALRYEPRATMQHLMPPERSTPRYLLRMCRSLGVASAIVSLLGWSGDYRSWRRSVNGNDRRRMLQALADLFRSVYSGRGHLAALAWAAFALGYHHGLGQVRRMARSERERLLGLAGRPCE